MIDFDAMVKNEEMADVILFLVSRGDNGMSYPSIDRFFGRHKADEKYESYNIKLIHETKRLEDNGGVFSGKSYSYKKGPNWKEPTFVTEKKYGIE
ncbi:hypothetical protein [Serratia entomophila]|uniref:hypothetical protein n=1 Tax=Serratia entomophila TaxID=42906 RepID=UPI00217C6B75|nr:hypothetical protein [Serratia entomophila]CAI1011889.1 Uncharacterised protein [Serratia entomophila]CAI1549030.1 Uncharacterised protein [Serratia entomophila]CAI1662317.1 Uncharacterised protein [Serratia entomophila]CAI1718026.1 Uncharacterised protein [Serratia entomophila]CAI1802547.1 Uncharacterised protein [Serratia entomophila]